MSSRAKYVFWKRQRATEPGLLLDKKKNVNRPVFDLALRRDTQYRTKAQTRGNLAKGGDGRPTNYIAKDELECST